MILDKTSALRIALQQMTTDKDVSSHPALLSSLTRKYPNSIQVISSVHPLNRYTCAMHAFEFVENPRYVCIAGFGIGRVYAGKDFMHWLIATRRLQEVATPEVTEGDLVVYFDGAEFKHIGISGPADSVCSKWGEGQLYKHGIDEVPSGYGDRAQIYKHVPAAAAMASFVEFAKEQGVPMEFVEHCLGR